MQHGQLQLDSSSPRTEVIIIEQPQSGCNRFRYECDGRSAGSIPGVSSTKDVTKYPTIQLINCCGPGTVIVSLVTNDDPPRPHPHSLVGKDCANGICKRRFGLEEQQMSFSGIGIQRKKRSDYKRAIEERLNLKVDPFRVHAQGNEIPLKDYDHKTVRLCFQVFLELADPNAATKRKFHVPTPAVSDPITDKQATFELKILDFAPGMGSCQGGEKIIVLCDKVKQNDIDVVFHDSENSWTSTLIPTGQVKRNDAFVLTVPRYQRVDLSVPVEVDMYLRLKSDHDETSEPVKFKYTPHFVTEEEKNPKNKKRKFDHGHGAKLNYPHAQPSVIDAAAAAAGVAATATGGGHRLDPLLSQTAIYQRSFERNDSTQDVSMSDQVTTDESQLVSTIFYPSANPNSPANVLLDDWIEQLCGHAELVDKDLPVSSQHDRSQDEASKKP